MSNTSDNVDELLLNLVHEISSMRAGKTFTPTDYTNRTKAQLLARLESMMPERQDEYERGISVHLDNQRVGYNQAIDDITTAIRKEFGGRE